MKADGLRTGKWIARRESERVSRLTSFVVITASSLALWAAIIAVVVAIW